MKKKEPRGSGGRTDAQRERQKTRDEASGRYTKTTPCYGCGKSSRVEYYSHPQTDCTAPSGARWGDIALVLCPRCGKATLPMTEPDQFYEYQKKMGGTGPRYGTRKKGKA